MRDASETTWWRRTRQLAAATAVTAAIVCCLPFLFAGWLGDAMVFGLPVQSFLTVIVAPLVVAAGAFAFVAQQRTLDHHHDVAEG